MKSISRVAAGSTLSTFLVILLLLLGMSVLVPAAEAIPILSASSSSSSSSSEGEGEGRTIRGGKRTRIRNHRRGRKLDAAVTTRTEEEDSMPPLAGGYSPVPDFENDAIVVEAAAFAFRELLSSSSPYSVVASSSIASNSNSKVSKNNDDVVDFEVLRASQQVVAGLNIRLDLAFRDSSGGCMGAGTVVVYNHFGDLSITSWKTNDDESLAMCEDKVTPASDTTSDTSDSGDNDNDVVVLEDFSNPMHDWGEMNDPVMGGESVECCTIKSDAWFSLTTSTNIRATVFTQ